MLGRLHCFDEREVENRRVEIIEMYDKYVEEVMKRAYGADRKIISRWKK
jgi:hypothetical protein